MQKYSRQLNNFKKENQTNMIKEALNQNTTEHYNDTRLKTTTDV